MARSGLFLEMFFATAFMGVAGAVSGRSSPRDAPALLAAGRQLPFGANPLQDPLANSNPLSGGIAANTLRLDAATYGHGMAYETPEESANALAAELRAAKAPTFAASQNGAMPMLPGLGARAAPVSFALNGAAQMPPFAASPAAAGSLPRSVSNTAGVTLPSSGDCTPQCSWQCESPRCDEICEPVCQPPRCETRCSGMDTSGCAIECEKPQCAVMCPERFCPKKNCASCTSTCSEPMCNLKCHNMQPCRNVCEQPDCVWNCKAPAECPAPQCRMVCESPTSCQGSTYKQLPPLRPGETAVQSFAAPLNIGSKMPNIMNVPALTVAALPARRQDGTSSMQMVPKIQRKIISLPVITSKDSRRSTKED